MLAPTIGILNWTKQEIQHIDVETRKVITYTGSLHKRSDTNRIYAPRKQGGRSLTSVEDMFISGIIALEKHIQQEALKNPILRKVKEHEQRNIIRLSMELKQELGIVTSGEVTSEMVKAQLKRRHLEMWKGKLLHGYLPTKIEKDEEIDDKATAEWKNTGLSSHVEGYTAALQEQEIATRATIKRRTKDGNLPIKCRLCEDKDATVFHVLCSCPKLSANLYTTARHDHVGEVLLNEMIQDQQQQRIKNLSPISMTPMKVIWWNKLITTTSRVKHNHPDIVIWDKKASVCTIIEIGVPFDTNVAVRQAEKGNKYMPLVSELQQMYPSFKYQIIPIIFGALGVVPKKLKEHLLKLNIKENRMKTTTRKLQKAAILGSVRVMKTFMNM